uniref:Immunoglobulin domain-containing protein n=1 Tax=Cyprinus carpio TaxID=7962 RepID=A0A8C1M9X4_CYPCA
MSVSVTEGDSVTLYTGVETIHQEDVKWYFKDTRIAQISGDLSKICTDVQCNKGTEQFRHRLKLDHQTGSLTITNIRTTDSGLYKLKIFSSNRDSENIFNITVRGFSSAERDKMKRKSVKERESVTFYPGVIKTNDLMTWYFFDTRIAEITGNRSYICTDVQCKDGAERFKNRLRVNLQSGSLTIIKTRITDSGVYKVNINSSNKISIIKSFSVDVIGLSLGGKEIYVVFVAFLLIAAFAVVIYNNHRRYKTVGQNGVTLNSRRFDALIGGARFY